ncbi:MAG: hypothetical protein A2498_12830 [Lentisphaerae bacterium RIFOXYC12_FULL_60_16]|nr:MAG: hypothetical protein A2498_12830 [Lentisphaerae bacterium RIFOXYC12_FULL_60_16]OGV69095.1 MAG: hypothetical protein A2269_08610 [Lentisphaerae bacterium RIFOXYA12_FULL_60_10]OGV78211.1 MAG: hypothetical protein A2340_16410 [Lentisphaerae bacterium RIFOXYB12_FULL_60_10]
MTIEEFRNRLLNCQTLADCNEFIRGSFAEISLLFYDVSREEMPTVRTDQKRTFDEFMASEPMNSVCRGEISCPDAITGLLILFGSFFERAQTSSQIMGIIQVPSFPERMKFLLHAIYRYRDIRDPAQYMSRFPDVMGDLLRTDSPAAQALLPEYFATGFLTTLPVDPGRAAAFRDLFTDPQNQARYPALAQPTMLRLYGMPPQVLEGERAQLNIHVVEAIYDLACHYISPPAPPDPAAGEAELGPSRRDITLPRYLNTLIFGPGGLAGPTPMGMRLREGLHADEAQQRAYLARYFPKSFAESYAIFRSLFTNRHVAQAIPKKRGVLAVLNIGSGTGGDTIGLLEAIADTGHTPNRIDVYSVEGNAFALNYQRQIIDAVIAERHLPARLLQHQVAFPTTRSGFADRLAQLLATFQTSFDVILTWKSFNEYYHHNRASAMGIYRAFLEVVAPSLAQKGVCVMLDVADSVNDDRANWFPIIMNNEVKAYLQNPASTLGHVLPLSCAHWATGCTEPQCYTQRIFRVSFAGETRIPCKTVFKVLAQQGFASELTRGHRDVKGFRCHDGKPERMCSEGRIHLVSPSAVVADGYELN